MQTLLGCRGENICSFQSRQSKLLRGVPYSVPAGRCEQFFEQGQLVFKCVITLPLQAARRVEVKPDRDFFRFHPQQRTRVSLRGPVVAPFLLPVHSRCDVGDAAVRTHATRGESLLYRDGCAPRILNLRVQVEIRRASPDFERRITLKRRVHWKNPALKSSLFHLDRRNSIPPLGIVRLCGVVLCCPLASADQAEFLRATSPPFH